jgi:hypothetical protein
MLDRRHAHEDETFESEESLHVYAGHGGLSEARMLVDLLVGL